jgi:CRISPR-associated protein (TIGR03984 family)
MQARVLKPIQISLKPLELEPTVSFNPTKAWLKTQIETYPEAEFCWLLAHADDGVIWGRREENGEFSLSGDSDHFPDFSPPLRAGTLQQLRLFGPGGELYVWRVQAGSFSGRWLFETEAADTTRTTSKYFDEWQILWGDRLASDNPYRGSYTLVEEGQGVRHAIPLEKVSKAKFGLDAARHRPLRLQVRHYLDYDHIGQARIYLSRLVTVRSL